MDSPRRAVDHHQENGNNFVSNKQSFQDDASKRLDHIKEARLEFPTQPKPQLPDGPFS